MSQDLEDIAVLEATLTAALEDAAGRPEFDDRRKRVYEELRRGDARLKQLCDYLRTEEVPPTIKGGSAPFGAIPALAKFGPRWLPDKKWVRAAWKLAVAWLIKHDILPPSTLDRSDWDLLWEKAGMGEAVDADGSIFGKMQYNQLDALWILSLYNSFTAPERPDFGTKPCIGELASECRIGVLGDWGTGTHNKHGPTPAQNVMTAVLDQKVDILIHLGDVYYSGTPKFHRKHPKFLPPNEYRDHFLNGWPKGREPKSFTLNANHDMYSHGRGYFTDILAADPFKHQNATSYFLLQNEHWQIFGLDTAYHDKPPLYEDGTLDPVQRQFLQDNYDPGRKVMLMSHHNALSLDGTTVSALWSDAAGALGAQPDYWYWGHLHNGVVYRETGRTPPETNATKARCVGHSAIPFGFAWGLTKSESLLGVAPGARPPSVDPLDTIAYFANEEAHDPHAPGRMRNGFAVLEIDGPNIRETFHDECGIVRWDSQADS